MEHVVRLSERAVQAHERGRRRRPAPSSFRRAEGLSPACQPAHQQPIPEPPGLTIEPRLAPS
jgi:hypothetical protein